MTNGKVMVPRERFFSERNGVLSYTHQGMYDFIMEEANHLCIIRS